MYLHNIVSRDKSELLSKFFWAQHDKPLKNDWWLTVKKKLSEFKLDHIDINELKNIKKIKFKDMVKTAYKREALKFLLQQKEIKGKTKMKNLHYPTLDMQDYLKSELLTTRNKKFPP